MLICVEHKKFYNNGVRNMFRYRLEIDNKETRYEPGHEKTCLRGFRPGPTRTARIDG